MICGNCGFNNVDGAATCANCGSILVNQQSAQEQQSQPVFGANGQVYQQNDFQQNYPNYGYQQMYQQPYQNMYVPLQRDDMSETVTTKEWVIALLLLCVPVVNFIMPFIWAFSDSEKKSKSNFFKAYLIIALISVVLSMLLVFLLAALGADMMDMM